MSDKSENQYKKLITFVSGTPLPKLEPVQYCWEGEPSTTTRYAGKAIAEHFGPIDEVLLMATPTATKTNAGDLETELRGLGVEKITTCTLQESGPNYLDAQFRVAQEHLKAAPGETVYVDITNGFRSLPFFAAAAIAFNRSIERESGELRVLYGAFEAYPRDDLRPRDLWDLSQFVDLLEWGQALKMFLQTGRADEVTRVVLPIGNKLQKEWYANNAKKEEGDRAPQPQIVAMAKALERFSADLATVRTGDLLIGRGSQPTPSAQDLYDALERASADVHAHTAPLKAVLQRIKDMVAPLRMESDTLSSPDGHRALVELANLYVNLDRFSEALTTIREGWVTHHSDREGGRPGWDDFDATCRSDAEKTLNEAEPKGWQAIREPRNDMQHGGYRDKPRQAKTLSKAFGALITDFEALRDSEPALTPQRSRSRSVFINLSNHPQDTWGDAQRKAALDLAPEIVDVPFPQVDPEMDSAALNELAQRIVDGLPDAEVALVQGEFTLCYRLVNLLSEKGVRCLAATTHRNVEFMTGGGQTSFFEFKQFRGYRD